MRRTLPVCTALVLGLLGGACLSAEALKPEISKALTFRNIGPTRQSGRFTDVAVPIQEPGTIYAATASGGLLKSVNHGQSWSTIFEPSAVVSIGDIAVAPSDPKVLYVGTGEANMSRSMYHGDGIYRSDDAGKTWRNVGLKDSHHIGRIVVHPTNPDVVYVAALGHQYTENAERGVFKSTDGGKTWMKSLDVWDGEKAIGAADLVMDPVNPDVLYATSYDRERKPWTFNLGGPKSGIWKSTDAGKTWKQLSMGLPGGMLGRIGLDVFLKDSKILYANVENANKPGMSDADRLAELRAGKASEGMIGEEVYRSDDAGETWKKVSPDKKPIGGGPGYYYMDIRVDPSDANHVYVLSVGVLESKDGGKTWASAFDFGGDNHALWIDPADSKHMILGYDHGMGVTFDGGKAWHHPDELNLAQCYTVSHDMAQPYNVYVGLQDNGSMRGPSTGRDGRPMSFEAWQGVGGGDGMFNAVDASGRTLYTESQMGAIARVDLLTGESKYVQARDKDLRFNWRTPIVVSAFDPNVVYHAAQRVLKSFRGEGWTAISPDLSTNDPSKLTTGKGGDGNINYCTITALSESPLHKDVLWAGTDDGNVWVTRDGGKDWKQVNAAIPNHPGHWVSGLSASHHAPGTAYLSLTGYRSDDFRPFVYKTTDFGATWTAITGNLPNKAVNVIREDPKNPNLLFVGADFGLFVTLDGGKVWTELKNNLPTTPVYDLQIHPREADLILGTHGHGVYITDISPLQELTPEVLAKPAHLFAVEPKVKWVRGLERVTSSVNTRLFQPSEPVGMVVNYLLKEKAKGEVMVQVLKSGRLLAEMKAPGEAGLQRVLWNLRATPPEVLPKSEAKKEDEPRRNRQDSSNRLPTFGGTTPVEPGEYTFILKVDGQVMSTTSRLLEDAWFTTRF